MLREVVSSSSLRSMGYDSRSSTLEVQFTNGTVYKYEAVPKDVWLELRRAQSKGRYFQSRVLGRYEAERVL